MVNLATIKISKMGSVSVHFATKGSEVTVVSHSLKYAVNSFWKKVAHYGMSDRNTAFIIIFEED